MATLRASEIGTYLYCQRAWWYQQSGYEPHNYAELAAGIELHKQHGRTVQRSDFLRNLAYFLFLAAGILALVSFILRASS